MDSNVIDNGAGEEMRFLRTAGTTDGAVLEFEVTIEPGTSGPPPHVHIKQEERFTVLRGTMVVRTGREEIFVPAGGHFVVPAGMAHTWRTAGDETLVVRAEMRPALRTEQLLRDAFAMMAANGGRIDPAKAAVLGEKYRDEYRFATIGLDETQISSWARSLYQTVDARDVDACLQFITDDASFRVGNAEPLVGRSAVASGLRQFWGALDGMKHHITNEWSDGDARIVEANVDYTRKDGRVVTIPAITVYAMAGDLVRRAQVFVDLAPVLG